MKRLYAPWRSSYTKKVAGTKDEIVTEDSCVFCQQFKEKKNKKHFILKRFKHSIIMLNLYPYNAGHLLILPLKHHADLQSLSQKERYELMEVVTISIELVKKALHAQGINVGLNLGKAAGAGIPSHIHFHCIPRWVGDTNFLPLIAETKQVSTDLEEIYKQLLHYFDIIDEKKLSKMKGNNEK